MIQVSEFPEARTYTTAPSVDAEQRKLCKGCDQKLPLGEFYRSTSTKDGRFTKCRRCVARERAASLADLTAKAREAVREKIESQAVAQQAAKQAEAAEVEQAVAEAEQAEKIVNAIGVFQEQGLTELPSVRDVAADLFTEYGGRKGFVKQWRTVFDLATPSVQHRMLKDLITLAQDVEDRDAERLERLERWQLEEVARKLVASIVNANQSVAHLPSPIDVPSHASEELSV